MRQAKRRSNCPISFALDIFGDKWALLIVRDLIFFGKIHYGELAESKEGIATNILADRLEKLERLNIIKKSRDLKNKTKYNYKLTTKGIDLLPTLVEISLWGAKYDPKTGAPKQFLVQMRKDKEGTISQIKESIKHNKFLFLK